jgi:hypothetical protein
MNELSTSVGHRPVKYFGHFLGPMDQLECQYNKSVWTEVAAIIYAPSFHTFLEIWCARIHAPDYLEEDTFVIDDSADRVLRRAAHFVTGLDLGLIEISHKIKAVNKLVV